MAVVEILVIVVLVLVNGTLAMSEAAFVAARKERLRERAEAGQAGAGAALALKEEPTRFLSTVQVGITLVGVLAGAFGGARVSHVVAEWLNDVPFLAPYASPVAFVLVVGAITYLSLVVGELTPKRIALADPERVIAFVARPVRTAESVLSPVIAVLTTSTRLLIGLLPVRTGQERPPSEAEVRALLEQGTQAGVFAAAEHRLVDAVFALDDRRVSHLMTPRSKIAWLDVEDPPEASRRKVLASGHSVFPVARGGLDEILGIVSAKALWLRESEGEPWDLEAALREAAFVPEHLRALDALEQFKRSGSRLLFVIDEHGSVEGLVTLTDILEEVVGDIPAEQPPPQAAPVRREDGSWLLDGSMPIVEASEALGVADLRGDGDSPYQTLGGLALGALGRMPAVGDRFERAGLRFEVVDMDDRRVDRLLAVPGDVGSLP